MNFAYYHFVYTESIQLIVHLYLADEPHLPAAVRVDASSKLRGRGRRIAVLHEASDRIGVFFCGAYAVIDARLINAQLLAHVQRLRGVKLAVGRIDCKEGHSLFPAGLEPLEYLAFDMVDSPDASSANANDYSAQIIIRFKSRRI